MLIQVPVGTKVKGNWESKGKFYPAKITGHNDEDDTYGILYDDGGRETGVRRSLFRVTRTQTVKITHEPDPYTSSIHFTHTPHSYTSPEEKKT